MSGSKIEVDVWRDEGPRIPSTPVHLKKHRVSATWVGLLGTIALHALLLLLIPFRPHVYPVNPLDKNGGAGATVNKPQGALSDPLILLDLSSVPSNKDSVSIDIASQSLSLERSSLMILSVDALPALNISNDPNAIESKYPIDTDPAMRAVLFRRYTGQISARIERLWKRPRSAVHSDLAASDVRGASASGNEHSFRCLVTIIQDRSGNVQEVRLPQCDSDSLWRDSLVKAVLAASPLPSPSVQSVFSHEMTIDFTGYEYTQGAELNAYATPFKTE